MVSISDVITNFWIYFQFVYEGMEESNSEGLDEMLFNAGNVDDLAAKIDNAKRQWELEPTGEDCREIAAGYSWEKIQAMYVELWKGLLK